MATLRICFEAVGEVLGGIVLTPAGMVTRTMRSILNGHSFRQVVGSEGSER